MAKKLIVTAPRESSFEFTGKNGAAVRCKLKFNSAASADWSEDLQKAQGYLDAETMRVLEPYMPLDTGQMIKSMISHTRPGGGEIRVVTPYAARVNYSTGVMGRNGTLRGRRFFDRMKADKLAYLKAFVYKATGIKVK